MSWFPDNQKLNMTEVIYPSQVTDTRAPDYPAPSAEWFLPSSVRAYSPFRNRQQQYLTNLCSSRCYPTHPPTASPFPRRRTQVHRTQLFPPHPQTVPHLGLLIERHFHLVRSLGWEILCLSTATPSTIRHRNLCSNPLSSLASRTLLPALTCQTHVHSHPSHQIQSAFNEFKLVALTRISKTSTRVIHKLVSGKTQVPVWMRLLHHHFEMKTNYCST